MHPDARPEAQPERAAPRSYPFRMLPVSQLPPRSSQVAPEAQWLFKMLDQCARLGPKYRARVKLEGRTPKNMRKSLTAFWRRHRDKFPPELALRTTHKDTPGEMDVWLEPDG